MAAPGLLVDTNVIFDVTQRDPVWAAWSVEQLERHALTHRLIINAVIYAELSVGYERLEQVDAMVQVGGFVLEPVPRGALFLAGKAYRRYREKKGRKTGVLPDFFIGAHAAVAGLPLLTRDLRRYRTYFPTVRLIAP